MRTFSHVILLLLLISGSRPVFAQLQASFTHTSPTTACFPNPLTVTFTNTSTGNPSSLLWKFLNPAGQVFTTSVLPNPVMSFSAVGKYTVRLIITGSGGQKDSVSLVNQVEIYEQPSVNITSAAVQGCLPLTASLAASGTPGAGATISSYQWAFAPANFPNLTGASVTLNITVPGTYTVNAVITDSHGCSNTATAQSHLVAYPALNLSVSSFPVSPAGCAPTPLPVTYTSSLQSTPPIPLSYQWSFGAASPATSTQAQPGVVTYTAPGSYGVSLLLTSSLPSCTASVSLPHHVLIGGASATFTVSQATSCMGDNLTFVPQQQVPGAFYEWDLNGDGTDDQYDPVVSQVFTAAGVYTARLKVTYNGCSSTSTQTFTVLPAPVANFMLMNLTPCQPISTIQTANMSQGAVSYQWDMSGCTPGSSTATDLTFQTNGSGSYTVTLIAVSANGCQDTSSTIFKIGGPSPALSLFGDSLDGCVPRTFTFLPVLAPTRNVTSWNWGFSGVPGGISPLTSTDRTPTVTVTLPGAYHVTLTMVTADGCTHSYTLTSAIRGDLFPDSLPISITPQVVCNRQPVTFSVDTTGHGQYLLNWDLKYIPPKFRVNASGAEVVDSLFFKTGPQTIALEVANGVCKRRQVVNQAFEVKAPIAQFGVYNPAPANAQVLTPDGLDLRSQIEICYSGSPFNLQAQDLTDGPGTSWQWHFNQTPQGTLNTSQPFAELLTGSAPLRAQTLKLVVENTHTGCIDSVTKHLYISAPTVVPDVHLVGCWPNSVLYLDHHSYGGLSSFYWAWDTNPIYSTQQKDTIYLADNQMHGLELTVVDSFGCKDIFTQQVQSVSMLADFTASPPVSVCGPATVTFYDQSFSTGASGIASWQWNFGEPSSGAANQATIPNPTHTYTSTDSFDIQLIVSDPSGCADTITYENFLFVSMPEIRVSVDTSTCAGNPLKFTNQSQQIGVTYAWDLGNNTTSPQKSPTATYTPATEPAQYHVTMTATDTLGCQNTYTQTIHIEAFEPDFTATPTAADCPPLNVQFTLAGTGNINAAQWNFGNGNTGSILNPLYTYQEPGTYTVGLTVFHEDGCSKSMTMPNLIQVLGPYGTMQTDKPAICPGDTVSVMVVTHDADSASVVFGDGDIVTAGNLSFSQDTLRLTHVYTSPGPKTVVAIGVSSLCSRAMTSYPLMVHTPPVAALAPVDTVLCLNTPRLVSSAAAAGSTPVSQWSWAYGDSSGNAAAIAVWGKDTGSFVLTHTVTDSAGCSDTLMQRFGVIPYPTVALSLRDSTLCAGDTAYVRALVAPAGARLAWQFNAAPAPWQGDSAAFMPGSSGVVSLTAADHACATDALAPLQVFSNPTPAFTTIVAGCDSPLVRFLPGDSLALAYRWFLGDSVFSNERIPEKRFSPGSYPIRYTAFGLNGCSSDTVATLVLREPPRAGFELWACPDMTPYEHTSFCIAPHLTVFIPEGLEVRWDFGDGALAVGRTVEHAYVEEDTVDVILTVTDPVTGCRAVAVHPHVVEFPDLIIPTFFSPNGDGTNEHWKVTYTGRSPVSSRIYDRWGRLMAVLPTLDSTWDGATSGVPAAAGVYFWTVQVGEREYKGNVTLAR